MIPIYEPNLGELERSNLIQAFDSTWISSKGTEIDAFEDRFASYVGTKHAVTCSSCTTGLHLALLALGVTRNDEVIVPSLTFIAPANAVLMSGARPVLAPIEDRFLGIDPNKLESLITSNTKAIILVHHFGRVGYIDEIKTICRRHQIYLIEDCAESLGATFAGSQTGSLGHIGVFSFFGNKTITTGEGGMITTDSPDIAKKIRLFRDHGMVQDGNYVHEVCGYNYRMTNLQAAIGLAQLHRLDEILQIKADQENLYSSYLRDVPCLMMLETQKGIRQSVNWLITATLENEQQKDYLASTLKTTGIETRRMIRPIADALHFQSMGYITDPIARDISSRSLHLPSSSLLARATIEFICKHVILGLQPA